jgi:hypothetical protein
MAAVDPHNVSGSRRRNNASWITDMLGDYCNKTRLATEVASRPGKPNKMSVDAVWLIRIHEWSYNRAQRAHI